jgi:hypothetical protein
MAKLELVKPYIKRSTDPEADLDMVFAMLEFFGGKTAELSEMVLELAKRNREMAKQIDFINERLDVTENRKIGECTP